MTRQLLMSELQRLEDELLGMGSVVMSAVGDAVSLLKKRDFEKSKALIRADWEINARYYNIEQGCMQLVATQQPTAGDLRVIASMIAISAELERIGDYAKGIVKINLLIGSDKLIKPLIDIPHMAKKAQGMLHRALLAFSRRDIALAQRIPQEDDEVDQLYDQVYRELFTYMLQNPHTINQGNYLLWAAHNLERTADRVTNICERVIYMVTGQIVEFDHSAEDDLDLPTALSQIEPVQKLAAAS